MIDVSQLPATKTKIGLILADVGQSLLMTSRPSGSISSPSPMLSASKNGA